MNNDSNNIINGSDLMLFVNGRSVAFATNHTLNITADTTEATNKDIKGGWTSSKIRKLSWTATTENLYAQIGCGNTYKELFRLMIQKVPVDLVFTVSDSISSQDVAEYLTNDGWSYDEDQFAGTIYKGKGLITSLEANAPDGDNATFTAEFTGVSEVEEQEGEGGSGDNDVWYLYDETTRHSERCSNNNAIPVTTSHNYHLIYNGQNYTCADNSFPISGRKLVLLTTSETGKPFASNGNVYIEVEQDSQSQLLYGNFTDAND